MTAVALEGAKGRRIRVGRRVPAPGTAVPRAGLPPLDPRLQAVRAGFFLVALFCGCLLLELLFVSPLQQVSAQRRAFDRLRADLAAGTAPLGSGDLADRAGDPIAYLEIPSIGLRQVLLEGTTAATLSEGPGHRRDTPMPGQVGTSVVMGRRAAYGGPFAAITDLERGSIIRVTSGAGVFDHRVLGVRHAGDDEATPVSPGAGRLVLATADGRPFTPSGLVLVDADLTGAPVAGGRPPVDARSLPDAERIMAIDLAVLWRLALWLQVLLIVVVGATWGWHRWDRAKTWVVFIPAFLLVGLLAADEAAHLLPNLL